MMVLHLTLYMISLCKVSVVDMVLWQSTRWPPLAGHFDVGTKRTTVGRWNCLMDFLKFVYLDYTFTEVCSNDMFDDKSLVWVMAWTWSGGWINIKMPSYQYRKSHCGDKTILRPSYLHNGISYTDKMTSLYWIGAQDTIIQVHSTPPHLHMRGSGVGVTKAPFINFSLAKFSFLQKHL